MKGWKVATISVLGTLAAVLGGFLFVDWLALRNFQRQGSHELAALLNNNMTSVLRAPAQTRINEKQSPQMLAAYVNAVRVGMVAARTSRTTALPKTSEAIQSLKPSNRVDAWGHPFCLIASGTRVAVISAGPEAEPLPACQDIAVSDREIVRAEPWVMYQFPSGTLVLVADSKTLRP